MRSLFPRLNHFIPSLISLLSFLLVSQKLIFCRFLQLLSPFFSCLFFESPILLLFLNVLFHNLISSFLSLIHLRVKVLFHVVHCHFDYVVCLVNLLDFLFGFIFQHLYFSFPAFICLFQFIVKFGLSLGKKFLPSLFGNLLTNPDLFIPILFRFPYLYPQFFSFFL